MCDAYSGCGWAPPYLCVWSEHLAAGRFLCTAPGPVAVSVFCVCLGSLWGVFCVLLCGAYSGHGWGLAVWRVFCARLWVYPVCYKVDNSPLFNFNRIFPPFSRSVPKPCAETSYLRVQYLCGRADVWGARAVGATILDVFGYGLPTESGVGSQWRCCYCRRREVGHPSENGMNSLGKFAFIPPFPLKI